VACTCSPRQRGAGRRQRLTSSGPRVSNLGRRSPAPLPRRTTVAWIRFEREAGIPIVERRTARVPGQVRWSDADQIAVVTYRDAPRSRRGPAR